MKGRNRRAAEMRRAGRGQKKGTPTGVPLLMEQGTGIEPASVAWEATILPMN